MYIGDGPQVEFVTETVIKEQYTDGGKSYIQMWLQISNWKLFRHFAQETGGSLDLHLQLQGELNVAYIK